MFVENNEIFIFFFVAGRRRREICGHLQQNEASDIDRYGTTLYRRCHIHSCRKAILCHRIRNQRCVFYADQDVLFLESGIRTVFDELLQLFRRGSVSGSKAFHNRWQFFGSIEKRIRSVYTQLAGPVAVSHSQWVFLQGFCNHIFVREKFYIK